MNNITKITKYTLGKNKFEYRGLLRNEHRFNMDEKIYFTTTRYNSAMLATGTIIGILKSISDNPEFLYTIQLTEDSLIEHADSEKNTFEDIICDSIFRSKEEAKQSALKQIERNYELSKEAIDLFFNNQK